MTDDDPLEDLEIPVVISKHGIRVKNPAASPPVYVPPHQRQDKTKTPVDCKK
jgi:hypothetical protein